MGKDLGRSSNLDERFFGFGQSNVEKTRQLIVDEASLEILACTASYSPDMDLVLGMLDELETKLPAYAHPVIHSDQGIQYQSKTYQARLKDMGQCLTFLWHFTRYGSFFGGEFKSWIDEMDVRNGQTSVKSGSVLS